MTFRWFRPKDWLVGLALGSVLGFLILGIGSRLGMRVIAHAQNQPAGFSLGGSMTVVFLGLVTGVAMAAIFLVCRILFPSRPWLRSAVFWIVCLALTLRGLNPVSVLTASVFIPLVLLNGALMHVFWTYVQQKK